MAANSKLVFDLFRLFLSSSNLEEFSKKGISWRAAREYIDEDGYGMTEIRVIEVLRDETVDGVHHHSEKVLMETNLGKIQKPAPIAASGLDKVLPIGADNFLDSREARTFKEILAAHGLEV